MKTTRIVIFLAFLAFIGCSKESGDGGTSSLTGKIKILEYNEDFSHLKATYYAQDKDVYLIYGDDVVYSDDYKTSPDGNFSFDYLRKGKYTIYVYSADSTGNSPTGDEPIYTTVEITKNGEDLDVGEITILKNTNFDNGTSSISGRVFVRNYNAEFTNLLAQYYGPDEDVFLVVGDDQYYSDDLKTDIDGWYKFENLPIGHYKVYAFSKDSTLTIPSGFYAVEKEINITANFQNIIIDDIIILK